MSSLPVPPVPAPVEVPPPATSSPVSSPPPAPTNSPVENDGIDDAPKAPRERPSASKYRGVYRTRNGRWQAKLQVSGKGEKRRFKSFGTFDMQLHAARAYDEAVRTLRPGAPLNFPIGGEQQAKRKRRFAYNRQRDSAGHGVYFDSSKGRFRCRLMLPDGTRQMVNGTFATEEEAAEHLQSLTTTPMEFTSTPAADCGGEFLPSSVWHASC
mmetsp:Transcript_5047/g.9665  ORF Transcript_5047/g.9665 Transcript_5047/m.9665 type:complete len:211 (-) Transcript_5047:60-692(-)